MLKPLTAWGVLFAVALAGCNKSAEQLPTSPVTGQITVDGDLAEGAQVTLHPLGGPAKDAGVRPLAKVNPDGSFKLTTYRAGDGAPAGEYAVTVQWQLLEYPEGEDAEPQLGPNLVDKSFANPRTTELRVTVNDGPNQLAPIDVPYKTETASRPSRSYEE